MPDALICDNCNSATPRQGSIDWLRVSDEGDIVIGFGQRRIEGTDIAEFVLARIAEDEAWAKLSHNGGVHHRRFSPNRVLAECEAKRRILAKAAELYEWTEFGSATDEDGWEILAALAAPYSDHPDFDPSWAQEGP